MVIQASHGTSLDQDDTSGEGDKGPSYGYLLKVKPARFAVPEGLRHERKKEGKMIFD